MPVSSDGKDGTNAPNKGDASSIHTTEASAPSATLSPKDLSKTCLENAAPSIPAAASLTVESKLSSPPPREEVDLTTAGQAPPVIPVTLQPHSVDASASEQSNTTPSQSTREATAAKDSISHTGATAGAEAPTINVAPVRAATVENATTNDNAIVEGTTAGGTDGKSTTVNAATVELAKIGATTVETNVTAGTAAAAAPAGIIPTTVPTTTPDAVVSTEKATDIQATNSAEEIPRSEVSVTETEAFRSEADGIEDKRLEEAPALEKETESSAGDVVGSPLDLGSGTRTQSKRPLVENIANDHDSGEKTSPRATRRMKP